MFMWWENSFLKYEFGCSFSLSDNSYYSQEFPSILFSPGNSQNCFMLIAPRDDVIQERSLFPGFRVSRYIGKPG